MPLYYASADVALLGGSFAPLGGQNLIEAAACGCPLLMGPHTFNFAQAAELALAAGAALRVADLVARPWPVRCGCRARPSRPPCRPRR
jgi:3-deoxy-D-manno-octulosonic-acid transferase